VPVTAGDVAQRLHVQPQSAYLCPWHSLSMVISSADNVTGEPMNMLRDSRYGLYMGALFVPLIVLGHIFPSNRSDDEFGGWILAINLATFLYYGMAGFLGVRKSLRIRDGFRMGALTAFVGLLLIIATFTVLDNIFLETVSQQVDKIRGFEHSHFVSMRAYINWSHLMGVITALPVYVLIGAACGGIGGILVSRPYSAGPESEVNPEGLPIPPRNLRV